MQTYAKKRIDLIIEMPLLRRVTERLDRAGATGYSVLPVIAGSGRSGAWTADGQISGVGHMAMIVCIVDATALSAVLDAVFEVVQRQIGLVTVTDVQVIRQERF
jgi:PII-like signaling protein